MNGIKRSVVFLFIILSAYAVSADADVYSLPVYFVKNVTGNVGFSSKAIVDYLPPDSSINSIEFKYYRMGNTVEFRTDTIYMYCQVYTTSKIKVTISATGNSANIPWSTTIKTEEGGIFGYNGEEYTTAVYNETATVYDETDLASTVKPRVWSKDFSVSVLPGDVKISNQNESTIGYITMTVEGI